MGPGHDGQLDRFPVEDFRFDRPEPGSHPQSGERDHIVSSGSICGVTGRIGVDAQGGNLGCFSDGGLYLYSIPVKIGATDQEQVIGGIEKGCCTLYLIAHRGGKDNEGGAITFPAPDSGIPGDQRIPILPDEAFEKRLNHKFFVENCCKDCVINLVTCGGDNTVRGERIRQEIADTTGCTVCGTFKKIDSPGYPVLSPDYANPWIYACKPPRIGPARGQQLLTISNAVQGRRCPNES